MGEGESVNDSLIRSCQHQTDCGRSCGFCSLFPNLRSFTREIGRPSGVVPHVTYFNAFCASLVPRVLTKSSFPETPSSSSGTVPAPDTR